MPIPGPTAVESGIGSLRRLHKTNDLNTGWRFAGLRYTQFYLYIENQAGTIKHYFTQTDPLSGLINTLNLPVAKLGTAANTPTVSNVVGFGGLGVGIESGSVHYLHFDTVNDQDPLKFIGIATVKIYDGASVLPRPLAGIKSFDVNGVTKRRLVIALHNDMTGAAAVTAWTTFLPNTRRIAFEFMGFLK